jgi:hemolysin activation/secretion protein
LIFIWKINSIPKLKNIKIIKTLNNSLLISFSISLLAISIKAAAADIDAGQILKNIERNTEIQRPQVLPDAELPGAPKEDKGPKVLIREYSFEGNNLISDSELRLAVASLTNREITFSELKTVSGLIYDYYHQKGFLVKVTLPDQDVTDGFVKIVIVEAKSGVLRLDGEYNKDFKRIKPEIIKPYIEPVLQKGQPLNQLKLNAALLELKNLSGIKVESALKAGDEEGTTDVVLKVLDQPIVSSYLSVDNTGSRQTGRNRALAYLTFASPLGYGESFNITALHTEGSDYAKLGTTIPLGTHGILVGGSVSLMSYDVIAKEFDSLKLKGRSTSYNANVTFPLLRNQFGKLGMTFQGDKKYFINEDVTGRTSDYDLQVYSAVMAGDYSDRFLNGGSTSASLDLGMGEVNLNHSNNETTDQGGAHTHGSYTRLRWNLSRNQFLTDSLALTLSGSGQFANANLDSSEKFYLGGINGVRAYPTSEGGGSEGYLYTAELRKYLPNNLSVAGFIDHGFVRQYYDNKQADGEGTNSQGQPNAYSLKGYGASLNWQGPRNTNFKVTYARRMGNNPNPATNGYHDQDGSKHVDVFWLSGSVNF